MASPETYGSPRVHAELQPQGVAVSRKHVARLMRSEGLQARVRKRYRCTTMSDHDQPVAANILDRRFEAERPNQRWVGDITEILTGGGKLYLAVILDLFSRMVVGWALSAANDRHLAPRPRAGAAAPLPRSWAPAPHRPGQPVRERRLPTRAHRARYHLQHESARNAHDNAAMESWFSSMTSSSEIVSRRTPMRRSSCSTTSRCSTTWSAGTRR